MNILVHNTPQEYKKLQTRPYQTNALKVMRDFTKKWINDAIDSSNDFWWNSVLSMLMATWAGKTATSGSHIKNIFSGRDALERIQWSNLPLKILVLNDRTTLVNQLYEANIQGKWWYAPLFGQDILDHAHIKVVHSKADKQQIINSQNEIIEIAWNDIDREEGQWTKDLIYFSTFQSAHKFSDEWLMFDVIIIDEAHHLNASTYQSVVQQYVDRYESYHWRQPLIMPMSATLGDLFGDPIVNYGLPEYLAGPYSPEVDYHLVTSSDFDDLDLEQVNTEIQRIQDMTDLRAKIKAIKELKEYIQEHLAQFGWLKELTQDMISRILKNAWSLDHTILFVSSIAEVDEITHTVNELTWDDTTAVWFHSKIDEADDTVLKWYESWKHKIIVAVDKLNEGIDLPATRNVVFRRWTESSIIFQQQFGRGLRSDQVSFYDYTGMMRNFAWIWDINQQISTVQDIFPTDEETDDNASESWSKPRKWINILIWDIVTSWSNNTRQIQLDQLVCWIDRLEKTKNYDEMAKEECVDYCKNQLMWCGITSNSQLIEFGARKFQKEFGLSLIGRILWRRIKGPSVSNLEELAWVLDLTPLDPKQELITQLLLHSITSSYQLIKFGPTKFQKEFGLSLIGTILWRTIKILSVLDLNELWNKLYEDQ